MRKLFLLCLTVITFVAGFSQPVHAQETYYIPPPQFNAAFQVMDLGFANIFGLFQNATGSLNYDETTKTVSRLRLAIDATSLIAGNADNQRALMAFFDVARYPEISLTSSDNFSFTDGKADVKATLILHGVSKSITLATTLNRTGKTPYGGGMWSSTGEALGLSMRGTFKPADFGLSDSNASGRFGDTVTLMLEVQALRQ